MKKFNQSNRFLKRPRTSDDIQNQIAHPSDDQRAKRSRLFSDGDGEVGKDEFGQLITTSSSPGESIGIDQNPLEWSLSQPLAGQFSNLDPVFTLDEE